MIYHQSKPIKISYRIQSLSNTRIRVSFRPWNIGTYRVYLAYRNFPIHGKEHLLYIATDRKCIQRTRLIEMLEKERKMCCQK